jgi:hypothetical protein
MSNINISSDLLLKTVKGFIELFFLIIILLIYN